MVKKKIENLERPKMKTKQYYDYIECRNYLEKKYKFKERSFGKDKKDFWFTIMCKYYNICNGIFITFSENTLDDIENTPEIEWAAEIYKYFLNEFSDPETGEVEFGVWW